ncbi:serine/threonine-protein kinase [Nocardia asteroides]|uniref:serine/threonine-protein kinase n=1 Tax=Nocardia asteroides TaxID=1824 RepID=UPI001E51575D|nr:serine/threonine-protein kinase [Nocardia asteroides]UGT64154.1 protein kinase [Nocardia asteroides]
MLRTGEVFAGYTIERLLGRGGMGSVYLARHPRLPRLTAMKLLNRELFADAEIRARFEREADLVARLDHPGIVPVYDRGVEDEQLWISMRYVDGMDAASLELGSLPPARAVRIVAETAAALDYAHGKGVLHRDVKPANIMIERVSDGAEERIFLTDFGIARLRDDTGHLTRTGTFTATLAYASPEQLSGASLDYRSDQYSLAVTLFRLLTGTVPFEASNPVAVIHGHLNDAPPLVSRVRPGLPAALDAVLLRAMAKHPGDRFASCAEFAAAARHALAGVASGPHAVPGSGATPSAATGFPGVPPGAGYGSSGPGMPAGGYGTPASGYEVAGGSGYGTPAGGYGSGTPATGYGPGTPASGYEHGTPATGYGPGTPASGYGAAGSGYGTPAGGYGTPGGPSAPGHPMHAGPYSAPGHPSRHSPTNYAGHGAALHNGGRGGKPPGRYRGLAGAGVGALLAAALIAGIAFVGADRGSDGPAAAPTRTALPTTTDEEPQDIADETTTRRPTTTTTAASDEQAMIDGLAALHAGFPRMVPDADSDDIVFSDPGWNGATCFGKDRADGSGLDATGPDFGAWTAVWYCFGGQNKASYEFYAYADPAAAAAAVAALPTGTRQSDTNDGRSYSNIVLEGFSSLRPRMVTEFSDDSERSRFVLHSIGFIATRTEFMNWWSTAPLR